MRTGFDCDGNCLNDADGDGVCDEFELPGCQDEAACNFNPDATDSDDSYTYADTGYDCDETASMTPTAMAFVINLKFRAVRTTLHATTM